jgi:nifR3 family TIM-barrel protein
MLKNNFWQKIPKPILALAPMDDVTDTVFRQIVASIAKPDVFLTEFVNVEGLMSEGREKLLPKLKYSQVEHPIVAQLWGINPTDFYDAAKMVKKMGFDGIDLNMGCPQKKEVKSGACAGLINNPEKAKQIIAAVRSATPDLPISIKTRIGFAKIDTKNWIGFLLTQKPEVLTIHGRTAKEMSEVPAHWDEIAKAVILRNQISPNTLIIGNGDIQNANDIKNRFTETGVDGVMVGRGIFHNLYVFDRKNQNHELTLKKRLQLLKEHLELYDSTWGNLKHYPILKKYFKIYLSGFPDASEIRNEFMETRTIKQGLTLVKRKLSAV